MADTNLKAAVLKQREELAAMLAAATRELAAECRDLLGDREELEGLLTTALDGLSHCKHLFVLDATGMQFIDNITRDGPDPSHLGRNRADRPYMHGLIGSTDFRLSEAYISRNAKRPMLTAVRVIRDDAGQHIGYLGADFDLRELPATKELYRQSQSWRQIKGDPAIRGGLFAQHREQSRLDDHLDTVLSLMRELMTERGVFHGKLHFSSNRATIWTMDDPYSYRLLDIDELLDPDTCLAFPKQPMGQCASIPAANILPVFELFRDLRFADDTIYLRSGSLNLCNGLVALNFSCDGTHYLPHEDLLAKGRDFWLGGQ